MPPPVRRLPRLPAALAVAALLAVAVLPACDLLDPDEPYVPPPDPLDQTAFLGFRFAPNDTVLAGDTVLVTAVIADSLDERFTYCWGGGTGPRFEYFDPAPVPGERYCPGRTLRYVTPTEVPDVGIGYVNYGVRVTIDNGERERADGVPLEPVRRSESFYVTEDPEQVP